MPRRLFCIVMALALLLLLGAGPSQASDPGFTTLDVNGEQVQIYRDAYGRPPHLRRDQPRPL